MTKLGRWVLGSMGFIGLTTLLSKVMQKTPRQKIVDAALSQVGEQDPDKYWAIVQPLLMRTGAAWCGGFALWALKQAGLAANLDWTMGKGFLFKGAAGAPLPITKIPLPGDIAYFSNLQHHAIVQSFDPLTGELHTIDGNQGPGEQVKTKIRNARDVTAFYSIEPLLLS